MLFAYLYFIIKPFICYSKFVKLFFQNERQKQKLCKCSNVSSFLSISTSCPNAYLLVYLYHFYQILRAFCLFKRNISGFCLFLIQTTIHIRMHRAYGFLQCFTKDVMLENKSAWEIDCSFTVILE